MSAAESGPAVAEATPSAGRPLALVTGATSGVGLAVARDLARDHDLILISRSRADLEALASDLTSISPWPDAAPSSSRVGTVPAVTVCPVDLTQDEAVAQVVGDLGLERLDVVVHSAGIEAPGRVGELRSEQWRRVLDLNVVAVAHLTSLLLPALRAARGLVVLINSGSGLHASAGHGLYCASKFALRALAGALREEERGAVRVTTVYPGRVDTPMQRRLQADHNRAAGRAEGSYRPEAHLRPASVAAAVRLAVDASPEACIEDLSVRPSELGR